jgi:Big-like domain-containing protein
MSARWRRAARAAALAGAVALAAAGCAKREMPTGGPPDVTPPRVIASSPDSGAAGVPLDAPLSVTFSEGMESRSTEDAVDLAPRIEIRRRHWKGRTLSLTLADSLRPNHTYTLFVSGSARDRHGNAMASGITLVFSTADSFPAGRVSGEIEARGFAPEATTLWCYDDGAGHRPDSTARDFDALALVDRQGRFSVDGLRVPGSYRLWAFADLNHNHSFEPDVDVLAPVDTTFVLTRDAPHAGGLKVRVVNPRAPSHARGTVVDSLADSLGVLRVIAVAEKDSTRHVVADVDPDGSFDLELGAGAWTVRAFRDLNRDRQWQPASERASATLSLTLEPAEDRIEIRLHLRPELGGP